MGPNHPMFVCNYSAGDVLAHSAPLGCERNARQVRGRVLAGVLRRRASKGYVEGDCDHDTLFYPSSRLTERHRGRIFRGPHHLQWGKRRNRWVRRSFAPADQHQHPHGRPREPQDRAKLIRVLKATVKGPQRGSQRPTNSRPHTDHRATTSAGDQARFSPQNGPPRRETGD